VLQYDYAVGLDFGGIDSQGAASAIARAQKAGMCSAVQLRAAAALAVGAERIRKQVVGWRALSYAHTIMLCHTSRSYVKM